MKKIEKLDYSKMVDDILEIIDTDFCMDMECKIEEKEYSQSEAETMARIISAVYKIAHCSYSNACNRKYQSQKQPKVIEETIERGKREFEKYWGKEPESQEGWYCECGEPANNGEHICDDKLEKQEEWREELLDLIDENGRVEDLEDVEFLYVTIRDFISQLLSERTEEILDKFWGDDELQKAIYNYGEWNDTKLNEAFKKVKSKLLEK
jgi:hypothetical protein